MHKLFSLTLLLTIIFVAAVPVYAAPEMTGGRSSVRIQGPTADATFRCTEWQSQACPSPYNVDMSPWLMTKTWTGNSNWPLTSTFKIICPAENPGCWDDYDVYYVMVFSFSYSGAPNTPHAINFDFKPVGAGWDQAVISCGTGTAGGCSGSKQGRFRPHSTDMGVTMFGGSMGTYNSAITIYFSLFPRNDCEDAFMTPEKETFPIDPTIEFPNGDDGTPVDQQKVYVAEGEFYQVEVAGKWNDGTVATRQDVEISWDGEEWEDLDKTTAECQVQDPTTAAITSVVVIAESATFYIRVNDTAGAFANNTDGDPPPTFTIGQSYELAPSCESQYSYDTVNDLVATVTVPSTNAAGVWATYTSNMTIGDWYTVKVVSGSWRHGGAAPDRKDMEFKMLGDPRWYEDTTWRDFSADESGVGCQSTDGNTWFIQAQNYELWLRVNDPDGNFLGNTGTLSVSIYHATFERAESACELSYESYGSPVRFEVAANASNGKSFAYVPDPDSPFAGVTGSVGTDLGVDVGQAWTTRPLEPGAWYMLDTIEGPWGNGTRSDHYDMAVNDGSGWIPLEDWTVPNCNVELDALGHRRLIFNVPEGPLEWFFRVNDSTSFADNTGYLGWNIYRSLQRDTQDPNYNPWISCLDDKRMNTIAMGSWIPVKIEDGTYLKGSITATVNGTPTSDTSTSTLTVGGNYGLEIVNGPWDDNDQDATAGVQYDAAISNDNGATWHPMNQSLALGDCVSSDQQERKFTMTFEVQAGEVWKIRVNDDPGDFGNNGGNLAYNLWTVAALDDVHGYSGGTAEPKCGGVLVRPTNVLDVSGWVAYVGASIRRFFIFCPPNANTILALGNALKTKEPFATVAEWTSVLGDIRRDMDSYDWDNGGEDLSILTAGGSSFNSLYNRYVISTDHQARDVWDGGDLVHMGDASLPNSYNSCVSIATESLPSKLAQGVCFYSAWMRETSASFWIQLATDIMAAGFLLTMVRKDINRLIAIFTGVAFIVDTADK